MAKQQKATVTLGKDTVKISELESVGITQPNGDNLVSVRAISKTGALYTHLCEVEEKDDEKRLEKSQALAEEFYAELSGVIGGETEPGK